MTDLRRTPELVAQERVEAMAVATGLIEAGFRVGITGIGSDESWFSDTRRAIEKRWPDRPIVDVDEFVRRFRRNDHARGVMLVHGIFAALPGIDSWALDFDGLPGLESYRYLYDLGVISDQDLRLETPNGRQVVFASERDRGFRNWTAMQRTWSFDPDLIPGPDGNGKLPGVDVRVRGGNSQVYAMRADGGYRWLSEGLEPRAADERLVPVIRMRREKPLDPLPRTKLEMVLRENYAAASLRGAYNDVAHAEIGDRNPTLNAVAYSLGRRFVSEGSLERHVVEHYLEQAACLCELDRDKGGISGVRATIASGLDRGIAQGQIERQRNDEEGEVTNASS